VINKVANNFPYTSHVRSEQRCSVTDVWETRVVQYKYGCVTLSMLTLCVPTSIDSLEVAFYVA